jgi:hypothetical protein
MLISTCFVSCGNKGTTENPVKAEKTTNEEVTDEGTPESKQAIAEAEAFLDWIADLEKKDKEGKLSDNEKIEALTELLKKNEEWDKKFKHLKESDFTPAQWKRMQEIKEKIKVTVN